MNTLELEPHIQKQVDIGESGTDILHGHLKTLMYDAEAQLHLAQAAEELSGNAMDSMERKYWEGVLDALGDVYSMTYALAFAIQERARERG
jgi:hypothetical protein